MVNWKELLLSAQSESVSLWQSVLQYCSCLNRWAAITTVVRSSMKVFSISD